MKPKLKPKYVITLETYYDETQTSTESELSSGVVVPSLGGPPLP